ncbi:MAG: nucleotidyltransferase domain-containing protein [Actinomycetota bacterium]|nr:nucleotidyltransferase domain-containing protein [Actinomycetota bacterium]
MPKVEEGAWVPPVDEQALGRLARALDREGVVAASLFGSRANETAGPLADIDLAVWADPGLSAQSRSRLRLDLAAAAAEALGTGEIDLVLLNSAPVLLRHRVMRDGRLIIERSRAQRVRLETSSLLEFLDTVPLRESLARGRRRRLAEGRFGRR